jgi:tetratricopeptide (TPR) repeat protein
MKVTGAEPNKPHPVSLAKADVSAIIAGGLAKTSMTLTFENAAERVLEGELVFPLPEGATVCAYALDVGGQLVESVTIEKDKARITFETEVRKGIDPGNVEKVQGNNFRTRVYPIPARGSRTIRVEYVSELIAGEGSTLAYQLPLKWSTPVKQANLRVEVVKAMEAPRADAKGLANLTFAKWEDRFVAEQKLENAKLDANITVALPPIPAGQAVVEKRIKATHSLENVADAKVAEQFTRAEHYFVINDVPPTLADRLSAKPKRICVAWDASLSRAEADHSRELALLERHLKQVNVPADLIILRNVAETPITFDSHDNLIAHLKSIPYDGGTSLSALKLLANYASYFPDQRHNMPPNYDYALLFTDGLSNLGPDNLAAAEVPVFAISADPRTNHAALSQIARTSGGAYLNLARMTDDQARSSFGVTPFSLLSIEHDESEITDIYPRTPQPLTTAGRLTITGKLLAKNAKLTLNYGLPGQVMHKVPITLTQDGAAENLGVVTRFWAQAKVADLFTAPDRHEDEITKIGKDFGLVTPYTSMIVLETVEQYLQHKIVPPKSRGEIYAQFMQRIEQQQAASANNEKAKIDRVVAMWNQRVQWWEKQYAYPKDFKYARADRDGDVGVQARLRGAMRAGEAPAPATGQPAATPAPSPASPAGGEPRRPAEVQVAEDAIDAIREQQERSRGGARGSESESRGRNSGGGGGLFGGSGGARDASPREGRAGEDRPADAQVLRQRQRMFYADGAQEWRDGSTPATQPNPRSGFVTLPPNVNNPTPAIRLKEWAPNAPYLKSLADAGDKAYDAYLKERPAHLASPAFYLDCADFLSKANQPAIALRILTNIPELALDDGRLIRIAAHRLQQLGHLDLAIDLFEKVTKLRPEEPQSFRDLALALASRAEWTFNIPDSREPDYSSILEDYNKSLSLLHKVVMNPWQRFEEIETLALMEANQILTRAQSTLRTQDSALRTLKNPFDPRLTKLLDLDLRIVLTWDTDNTDIDLHVVEPSGETADYSHNRTTIGGLVSTDFTQGYGPEEYCLRKAMPGEYKVKAHFFGNRDQKLVGPTTLQASLITNFGRPDEKRQAITLRLKDAKDWVEVGSVTLGESK